VSGSTIVGQFTDAGANPHGFYLNGSTWTQLDAPLAQSNPSNGGFNGTHATSISGSTIAGWYGDSVGRAHGFLFDGTNWTTVDAPLAMKGTFPTGISGNWLVGYYEDTGGSDFGFLFDGTTWTTLHDPLGVTGTVATGVFGNNIVGWYGDSQGRSHGFLYDGITWTTIDDPDAYAAIGTTPTALDGNRIVGYFATGTTPNYAAFVTSVPEPCTILPFAVGGGFLFCSVIRKRSLIV
jgi:hypothetical protein